jgi:Fe-S cluster assembly iron-binding protein IscA
LKEVIDMLKVTKKAAAILKAAKAAEGATGGAGIRLRRGAIANDSGNLTVGFAISDEPDPDDEEFEQEGLRIFVEDALVEPLDGRTLDVRDANEGLELVFR